MWKEKTDWKNERVVPEKSGNIMEKQVEKPMKNLKYSEKYEIKYIDIK